MRFRDFYYSSEKKIAFFFYVEFSGLVFDFFNGTQSTLNLSLYMHISGIRCSLVV